MREGMRLELVWDGDTGFQAEETLNEPELAFLHTVSLAHL
jgi:hypothetical protein